MLNICNNMQYHDKYAISWQICYIRNSLADGDGSAARMKGALATATALWRGQRRLGGEDGAPGRRPLREKHKHGVSFGIPLEFQNLTTE